MMSEHRECISDMGIRAQEIAKEILRTSQSMLLVRMRFLDVAIFQLQPEEVDFEALQTVATDGEKFYYNADYVLKQYVQDQQCMTRKIMHSLLHCIFVPDGVTETSFRAFWSEADEYDMRLLGAVRNGCRIVNLPPSVKTIRLDSFGENTKIVNIASSTNVIGCVEDNTKIKINRY